MSQSALAITQRDKTYINEDFAWGSVPWDLSASPLYPHLPTKDAAEESQRSLIPVLLDGTARDPDCAFLRAEPGWPELLARYQT